MTVQARWGRALLALAALLLLLTGCTRGGEPSGSAALAPFRLTSLTLSDREVSFADSTSVDLEILIPQVEEPKDHPLGQALNDYFQGEGDALLGQIRDYMGLSWGVWEGDKVTVRWTYEVTRNDGQWLSVRRRGVLHIFGHAYPTVSLRSDNFRVSEGALQPIFLEEAFDLTPEEAQAYLVDQMAELSEGVYDRKDLNSAFDFRNFYLTNDTLILYYQEEALGPHALGTPEFSIPLSALSPVLKEGVLLG